MLYQQPLTVYETIKLIESNLLVLPQVGRNFSLRMNGVELLFDNLIKGNPLGNFIFWKIPQGCEDKYKFFKIPSSYSNEMPLYEQYDILKPQEIGSDVRAVIAGQQRLSALLMALRGTFKMDESINHYASSDPIPEQKLYAYILSFNRYGDYSFEYMTDDALGFICLDEILNWGFNGFDTRSDIESKLESILIEQGLTKEHGISDKEADFARNTLFRLYEAIYVDRSIHYYLEEDIRSTEHLLDVYINSNGYGLSLSYLDELLVCAEVYWRRLDARAEISKLHFAMSLSFNDTIFRTAILLSDIGSISFERHVFTKANCLKIEAQWELICNCLLIARDSLSPLNVLGVMNFGMLELIAYFIKVHCSSEVVLSSGPKPLYKLLSAEDCQKISSLLCAIALKQPALRDQRAAVFLSLIDILKNNPSTFPLEKIVDVLKEYGHDLTFTDAQLEKYRLLSDSSDRDVIFNILYSDEIHADHDFMDKYRKTLIHQEELFSPELLKDYDVTDRRAYKKRMYGLGNTYLQKKDEKGDLDYLFLSHQVGKGVLKEMKPQMTFLDWLDDNYGTDHSDELYSFLKWNYIPVTDEKDYRNILSFDNFVEFYDKRFALIKAKLAEKLGLLYIGSVEDRES